jgi:hypothetical protein
VRGALFTNVHNLFTNSSTDGTAASHRQRAALAVSTLKPSHRGSSQNHREKNATPTASEATAVGHRFPSAIVGASDCSPTIGSPVRPVSLHRRSTPTEIHRDSSGVRKFQISIAVCHLPFVFFMTVL